ncbi:tripartite tricarboxylate transporter TctB family protein [Aquibacillus albus]|uniref:Tricarboxylic transport membrane protein n=1 Tax=Aquibacillus albus TaxID=1168171 RepID=A0ABS2N5J0_9BACI|nr:tripartite tricarboxylate transporter TctB family protein [Aquibacillus albus]MBM7573349.1 putative tricarboxylic transport membrane protein [Aquibacillus albus]
MANRVFSIIVLAICSLFFIESMKFSEKSGVQTFAPSFFPRVILVFIAILSVFIVIKSFKQVDKEKLGLLIKHYVKEHYQVLAVIGIFFVYIGLISIIGFLWSSILFLFITFSLLRPIKRKALITNLTVAIVLPIGIQFVFQQLLNIYLP